MHVNRLGESGAAFSMDARTAAMLAPSGAWDVPSVAGNTSSLSTLRIPSVGTAQLELTPEQRALLTTPVSLWPSSAAPASSQLGKYLPYGLIGLGVLLLAMGN